MYVARILYPVKVLGPGNRIGIWVSGCNHRCKGCSNPELWKQEERYKITKEKFRELVLSISSKFKIDGFTLTGGDPFFDLESLEQILSVIYSLSDEILVYTGYTIEKLQKDEKCSKILSKIAVLIDGPYIEDKNENVFLRGSSNQKILILNDKYRDKYENYISSGYNQIQNFVSKSGFISVGIHNKGYESTIDESLNIHSITTS